MLRYSLGRLLLLAPLLFGLSVLTFLYMRLVPGDPIAGMLGPGGTPQLIHELRSKFGLDDPLLVQYGRWLASLFAHGDLGISFGSGQAITPMLINRIPATLQLTAAGMFFTVLIGLPAGFFDVGHERHEPKYRRRRHTRGLDAAALVNLGRIHIHGAKSGDNQRGGDRLR